MEGLNDYITLLIINIMDNDKLINTIDISHYMIDE